MGLLVGAGENGVYVPPGDSASAASVASCRLFRRDTEARRLLDGSQFRVVVVRISRMRLKLAEEETATPTRGYIATYTWLVALSRVCDPWFLYRRRVSQEKKKETRLLIHHGTFPPSLPPALRFWDLFHFAGLGPDFGVCFYSHQAPAGRKSHKSTRPPENAAGRVNKQPPAKSKATVTASSSRQSAAAGSSKNTQKPAQKPAVVGKPENKRKAAEDIEEEEDEERMIITDDAPPGLCQGRNQANEAAPTGPGIAKMPILKARVRHIPQDVVEGKWTPLSEKARDEVLGLVKAAERPVLMTFRQEKQKAQAQEGLGVVMRKYGDRL